MSPHPLTYSEMQKYYQNEPNFNGVTDILKLKFTQDSKNNFGILSK